LSEPEGIEYGINPRESGAAPLDLPEIFRNDHPVIVEIGSGKGRFLVDEALAHPELNYLGIEKSLHYYRVLVDRMERRNIANVRVINFDAALVLRDMLAEESIAEVHIYFPDPWPRKRERKRRFVQPAVLPHLERALRRDGVGVFVTDHREYFEHAAPLLASQFDTEAGEVTGETPPRTNYEAKYRQEGRPIYQVMFRRRR
jgi:tRNA (guanine-N7-)-methyltransferase